MQRMQQDAFGQIVVLLVVRSSEECESNVNVYRTAGWQPTTNCAVLASQLFFGNRYVTLRNLIGDCGYKQGESPCCM